MQLKSEGMLKMLSIGAVDHDAVGGGAGSGDALRPVDVAAALGMIGDDRYRAALMVKGAVGDDKELISLLQLIRKALPEFSWFKSGDMRSSAYRTRVDRLSRCAVAELIAGESCKTVDKADGLSLSVRGFNKTWAGREREIVKLISHWALMGDNTLCRLTSEGRKCV